MKPIKNQIYEKNNVLSSGVFTYEYEYNSENYPTKIIKKNGSSIVSTEILEYESN
jgi:hypothetical protein